GISERHSRIRPERLPLLRLTLGAIADREGLCVATSNAEDESGRLIVEIVDPAARRRLHGLQKPLVEAPPLAHRRPPVRGPRSHRGRAGDSGGRGLTRSAPNTLGLGYAEFPRASTK